MNERKYRMYGLVPYNISPIQQGIQFGHAVVEYQMKYGKTSEYHRWSVNDKTFIILNGGTTNNSNYRLGTLNKYNDEMAMMGIRRAQFNEPDLGDQLTAVVFLVDDRVWDREAWPDYNGSFYLDGTPDHTEFWNWKMKFSESEEEADQIVFLRGFLPKFRLA